MRQRVLIVGKYLGYTVFAFFVLVITAYMVFPFERLKNLIARELAQGGRYEVTIRDVSPAFLLGVSLEGVRIVSPPEKPKEKKSETYIKRATVTFGLFSLLAGEPEISFDLEAFGGHIEGETQKTKGTRRIEVAFNKVAFKKLPGIAKAIDLPMGGSVSGRGKLTIPREGYRKMKGKLTLKCNKCTIGDGKTKVKPKFGRKQPGRYDPVREKGVTLPKIRLGRFGGDIEIKKGKAEFSQFEAFSPDGEAKLLGYVLLREPILFSTVQAVFKLKFSEEFKKKKPKIIGIEASMARGKRSDGLYGMCITQRLKNIRFRPCRYSAAERGSRGGSRNRGRFGRGGGRRRQGSYRRPNFNMRGASPAHRKKRLPRPPRRKPAPGTGGPVGNY